MFYYLITIQMSKKLTVREVAKELYGSNYWPYLIYGAAIAIRWLAKTYGKTESEVIDDLEEEFTKITEAGEKFIKAED